MFFFLFGKEGKDEQLKKKHIFFSSTEPKNMDVTV